MTTFDTRAKIVSRWWLEWKEARRQGVDNAESWDDFVAQNDLGLPLAFAYNIGYIPDPTEQVLSLIQETYYWLVTDLGLDPEQHFESLEEMANAVIERLEKEEDEEDAEE